MRELMNMFGNKVDLVLASYNAGEGAVLKYGRNVPLPYCSRFIY
jgi:soluble lytic murein transglycosylase-like protein